MNDDRLIPAIPHRPDRRRDDLLSQVPAEPVLDAPAARVDASESVEERVVGAIKTIFDPEIPVNIYELGLIYDVDVSDTDDVKIAMTLTSPACPVAGSLPGEVEAKVAAVAGVKSAAVELTWDPPWTPDKMSEEAKLLLNLPY